jgi:hypothetical protein
VVATAGGAPSTTVVDDDESTAGTGCSGAIVAGTTVTGDVVGVDAVEAGTVGAEDGEGAVVVGTAVEVVADAAVEAVVDGANVDDDDDVDGGEAAMLAETSVVGALAELSLELDEQPARVATVRLATVNEIQVRRAPINCMSDPRRRRRVGRAIRRCARASLQPAGIVKKPRHSLPRS